MKGIFIMLKPEATEGQLGIDILNEILGKFKSLKFMRMKRPIVEKEVIMKHYIEHKDKDFYFNCYNYFINRQVTIVELVCDDRKNTIIELRKFIGDSNPEKADADSIRGRYGYLEDGNIRNMIHVSDSEKSADREIKLWFG